MKKYFLGWYFKNTNKNSYLAIIPGIAISGKEKHAFIQVITDKESFYVNYDYAEFKHSEKPFFVKIGKSYFSLEKVILDIESCDLKLEGELNYKNHILPKTSLLSPSIMGPFSYLPSMQCKHGILSMKHDVEGKITLNNKVMNFKNSNGYIEMDSGRSFPKKYIWLQGNDFKNGNVSLMLAIATIPYLCINFTGLISNLYINGKEYRFATYNNSKIETMKKEKNKYFVKLKNSKYKLETTIIAKEGKPLKAPVGGKMKHTIKETLGCVIKIKLRDKKDNLIYSGTSKQGGFEWQY